MAVIDPWNSSATTATLGPKTSTSPRVERSTSTRVMSGTQSGKSPRAKPYFERFGHPTHRMTRVAINGPLPNDIGTGFAEVQEWEFEATCHPVIPAWFWRHFSEGGWAPCLPGRVWPAEVSQSQGGDHLLREADWGLVAWKQGPGLLRHRQIHPGQQGRWRKAHKEVGDRPRRARLPCPGHPPLGHFGRSANEVRAGSHLHLLRWFQAPVRPPEGEHAGLRPHQPPLYSFKVWTRWGRPSGNRFHLYKENGALQARGGRGLQTSWGAPERVLPHLSQLPRQGHHEMGLPQPSGVTRARASTCRCNTQPTSPSLTTKQQKGTSLPAPRRATTIPWPGISWAT